MTGENEKQPKAAPTKGAKVAIILIRSTVSATTEVEDTLKMLRLMKKNTCAVFEATPDVMGMVNKVKDYVTYGMIDDATHKLLQEKRGQKDKDGKIKNHFHLSPPRGGHEKNGIKKTFDQGGVLGNRKDKIGELIQKMI